MIKKIVRNFIYGYKATSERYEKHLRKAGASIGKNFKIFSPTTTVIDHQNAYMIEIGDDVSLTGPVTIMTHDYSWRVFKNIDGRILGNQQPVKIGNNVFIGWGATILCGAVIGDNVIIGAGSLVTSKCESDSVYAGVPAKRIMSLEEYRTRRENRQLFESKQMQKYYERQFGKKPGIELFHSFFPVFTSKDNLDVIVEKFNDRLELEGNKQESIAYLKNKETMFNSFEEFLNYK